MRENELKFYLFLYVRLSFRLRGCIWLLYGFVEFVNLEYKE